MCILLSLALLIGPQVLGQESTAESERNYYFMIDASGSMKPRMADALLEAQKRRSEIEARDPGAVVYVRFFRATTLTECGQPISNFATIQPGDSLDAPLRYHDDFSPIGGALRAAIEHSADTPADVILVTDAAQSSGCGPSVADVVSGTSDKKDIAITSILIAPRDSDLEAFKEIEQSGLMKIPPIITAPSSADDSKEVERSSDLKQIAPKEAQSSSDNLVRAILYVWNATLHFFDLWLWLVGFVGLAWSAAWIGRVDSNRTVSINNFTREARSQKELIRQNDPEAAAELKKIEDAKKKLDRDTIVERSWLWKRKALPGWMGFATLAALAFLPPRFGPIGLEGSKSAAWAILDSEFATAFAAIWIALIVYAGRENQRLSEAECTFDVVTKEAERLGELERSEAQKNAYAEFETDYARLENIEFPKYWQDDEVDDNDRSNFELVVETAIELAKTISVGRDAKAENAREASHKLKDLHVKTEGWLSRTSFARFIDKLIQLELIKEDIELWNSLAQSIKSNNQMRMANAFSVVADAIRPENPS